MRIKNDTHLAFSGDKKTCIGKENKAVEVRVISFCDREERTEYRLATNLPEEGELAVTSEEIADIYRKRWQI